MIVILISNGNKNINEPTFKYKFYNYYHSLNPNTLEEYLAFLEEDLKSTNREISYFERVGVPPLPESNFNELKKNKEEALKEIEKVKHAKREETFKEEFELGKYDHLFAIRINPSFHCNHLLLPKVKLRQLLIKQYGKYN